jgi:hypothetical protein
MITQKQIDTWWENLPHKNRGSHGKMLNTLLIAQPRSGSTWFMNMVAYGCNSRVCGDRNPEIDRALIKYASEPHKALLTIDPIENIRRGEFIDNLWWSISENTYNSYKYRIFFEAFFGGMSFRKITNLGWGNNNGEELDQLIEIIDGIEDHTNQAINVIWLIRDEEEIALSLADKIGRSNDQGFIYRAKHLAQVQKSRMLGVRRLDDTVITYKQLCEDPLDCLSHANLYGYRPQKCLLEIINKKIR